MGFSHQDLKRDPDVRQDDGIKIHTANGVDQLVFKIGITFRQKNTGTSPVKGGLQKGFYLSFLTAESLPLTAFF